MSKRKKKRDEEDYKYLVVAIGVILVLLGVDRLLNPTSVFNIIGGIVAVLSGLFLATLPIAPDIAKDFAKAIITILFEIFRLVAEAFVDAVNGLNRYIKERKKRSQEEGNGEDRTQDEINQNRG